MTAKKYFYSLVILLFAFMALNLAMWYGFNKKIFLRGDLSRMGSFATTDSLTQIANYSRRHTKFRDYLSSGLDVITIGDSFSNGGGKNYYQDYLTDKYGLRVLNFSLTFSPVEDLYILVNSGLIDKLKPRVIILESVGRYVNGRLGTKEIQANSVKSDIVLSDNKSKNLSDGLFAPIMIKANYNYLSNKFYRLFHPEQLSPEVYINTLNQNLFTNPGQENILLTYYEDLNYLHESINPAMIHANLNNAAEILRAKNIKLVFMPCVDKYDLYFPYIINKHGRPENNLFAELDSMPGKNYIFVNTKKILRKALERGEKDLYWLVDTHWSWKGFQIVCDEFVREIL
ncbi:MAG: hypothetical protein IJT21_09245 [Synergistaceae bacterium]|nr:hypothetical protein [Synergistaceae bacterium]